MELFIFLIALIITAIFLFKNNITYKNYSIINKAVFLYNSDRIKNDMSIDFSIYKHIEEYDKTFFRLWAFGYKNILPPEDFKKIEPFIEKAKEQIRYE